MALLAFGACLSSLWFAGRWAASTYHLRQARVDLDSRQAEAALKHLESAAGWWPDRAETEFLFARTYRHLGQLPAVRIHLERAWKLGYPVAKLEREQWLTLAQNGQIRDAEVHLRGLLTEPEDDAAEISEAYVNGYLLNYRFASALGLLSAWEADLPEDPQPHFMRGAYYEHTLQAPRAIEEYETAVTLGPERDDVRLRLAQLLVREHRQDEARPHFQHLRTSRSDDPDIEVGWARCLLAEGRIKDARRILDEVIENSPDHAAAWLERGRLALQAGDTQVAVELLERFVRESPWNLEARYMLGSALAASGRTEAAREHLTFVEQARPAVARARLLIEQVTADPADVQSRYEIGSILLRFAPPEDGVGWLKSVLDLRPDHGPTHRVLADHFARMGEAELAARHRLLAQVDEPTPDR